MSETEQPPVKEYPQYRSHNTVRAFKIKHIVTGDAGGGAELTPQEEGIPGKHVSADYMAKIKPQVGGYYIVDGWGFEFFLPDSHFEDAYERV